MKNSLKSDDHEDPEENTIKSNLTNIMNEGLNDEKLRGKFSSGETTLRSKDSGLKNNVRGTQVCQQNFTLIFFCFLSLNALFD